MANLDKIDLDILKILKENARESISSISNKVNLSRPSVSARILKMEEEGIIKKYTIEINDVSEKDKIVFYTLLSDMKKTGDHFFDYMNKIPEIKAIDVITGKSGYLIKAEVNNLVEMQDLLKKLMKFSTVESFISLKHVKID